MTATALAGRADRATSAASGYGRWYVLAAAQQLDQNASVAVLDEPGRDGLPPRRPRLGELAESTCRLLPNVRVPLVLIDEGASTRRDGRIAPVTIIWRTRRPARALP